MGICKNNYILCYHEIKQENLNKEIQIINFCDSKSSGGINEEKHKIENKCTIYINGKEIKFTPKYIFKIASPQIIKIKFKEPLINGKSLFEGCSTIRKIEGNNFNASLLKNSSKMFGNCKNLEEINISTWDMSNVEDMNGMFENDFSLKEFCAPNWNTKNVKNMKNMFFQCESLKKLVISNWDLEKCTQTDNMFSNCKSLEELDISKWKQNLIINSYYLFNDCNSLKKIYLPNCDANDSQYLPFLFKNINKDCEIDFKKNPKEDLKTENNGENSNQKISVTRDSP